jgi:hypothetical protein
MGKVIDLTFTIPKGTTLFVYARDMTNIGGQACWWCHCFGRCGGTNIPYSIKGQNLRNGNTTSCGCEKAGRISKAKQTHGFKSLGSTDTQKRTYEAWENMKKRCDNPWSESDKRNYKEKGITYDPRWEHFEHFLADMGECPNMSLEIDRIKNDLGYCKDNCRWTTDEIQGANKECAYKWPYEGELLTAGQLANRTSIDIHPITLLYRLKRILAKRDVTEDDVKLAMSTPVR